MNEDVDEDDEDDEDDDDSFNSNALTAFLALAFLFWETSLYTLQRISRQNSKPWPEP